MDVHFISCTGEDDSSDGLLSLGKPSVGNAVGTAVAASAAFASCCVAARSEVVGASVGFNSSDGTEDGMEVDIS